MTIIYDLDNTLLTCSKDKKTVKIIHREEIDCLNMLYNRGHVIIIHTGRNWDKYQLTIQQLNQYNIQHHQLIMGKPQGVYIDATSNFITGKDLL